MSLPVGSESSRPGIRASGGAIFPRIFAISKIAPTFISNSPNTTGLRTLCCAVHRLEVGLQQRWPSAMRGASASLSLLMPSASRSAIARLRDIADVFAMPADEIVRTTYLRPEIAARDTTRMPTSLLTTYLGSMSRPKSQPGKPLMPSRMLCPLASGRQCEHLATVTDKATCEHVDIKQWRAGKDSNPRPPDP